jgi:hypothetical protein
LEGCCSTIELHPRTGVRMWGRNQCEPVFTAPFRAKEYLAGNFPETTLFGVLSTAKEA